jgi:hypothetical protein
MPLDGQPRTPEELSRALGSVVFDLQLLTVALLIEKQGYQQEQRRIMRHRARLATEVLLLKSRALLDFMAPYHPKPDDIRIDEFGERRRALTPELIAYREYVNKRAAHLTWRRTLAADSGSVPDMHACAYLILRSAHECVTSIMASGIALQESRHERRYEEFLVQLEELRPYVQEPESLMPVEPCNSALSPGDA